MGDNCTTGVRYVLDEKGEVFFVWLKCFNEEQDPQHETYFFTTDCIIEKIENATGELCPVVTGKGVRGNYITYSKGNKICGDRTYYVHDKNDLVAMSMVEVDKNGRYYVDTRTLIHYLAKSLECYRKRKSEYLEKIAMLKEEHERINEKA